MIFWPKSIKIELFSSFRCDDCTIANIGKVIEKTENIRSINIGDCATFYKFMGSDIDISDNFYRVPSLDNIYMLQVYASIIKDIIVASKMFKAMIGKDVLLNNIKFYSHGNTYKNEILIRYLKWKKYTIVDSSENADIGFCSDVLYVDLPKMVILWKNRTNHVSNSYECLWNIDDFYSLNRVTTVHMLEASKFAANNKEFLKEFFIRHSDKVITY